MSHVSDTVTLQDPGPASVSDNSGSVTWTSDWPVVFMVGVTVVNYTAIDASGNQAHCTVNVTIEVNIEGMFYSKFKSFINTFHVLPRFLKSE